MVPLKSEVILTVTSIEACRVGILCSSYICHYEADNDYSHILKHIAFIRLWFIELKEAWLAIMCFSVYRKKLNAIYVSKFPQFHRQQMPICIWECQKEHDKDPYTTPSTDKMLKLILFLFRFAVFFIPFTNYFFAFPLLFMDQLEMTDSTIQKIAEFWDFFFMCHLYCNKWKSLVWNLKTHTPI